MTAADNSVRTTYTHLGSFGTFTEAKDAMAAAWRAYVRRDRGTERLHRS